MDFVQVLSEAPKGVVPSDFSLSTMKSSEEIVQLLTSHVYQHDEGLLQWFYDTFSSVSVTVSSTSPKELFCARFIPSLLWAYATGLIAGQISPAIEAVLTAFPDAPVIHPVDATGNFLIPSVALPSPFHRPEKTSPLRPSTATLTKDSLQSHDRAAAGSSAANQGGTTNLDAVVSRSTPAFSPAGRQKIMRAAVYRFCTLAPLLPTTTKALFCQVAARVAALALPTSAASSVVSSFLSAPFANEKLMGLYDAELIMKNPALHAATTNSEAHLIRFPLTEDLALDLVLGISRSVMIREAQEEAESATRVMEQVGIYFCMPLVTLVTRSLLKTIKAVDQDAEALGMSKSSALKKLVKAFAPSATATANESNSKKSSAEGGSKKRSMKATTSETAGGAAKDEDEGEEDEEEENNSESSEEEDDAPDEKDK